jgi:thioredoxin reductase (NADPH)
MAPISLLNAPEPVYDAAIIGAGPTGLACAIEIEKKGLKAIVIDKGCLVNSLYNYPTNLTFFTTPELLEIGGLPMTSVREKPNRTEALKYYRRVAMHYELDVRQYERVDDVKGSDGNFVVQTTLRTGESNQHRAKKVIVSTGYYDIPVKLGSPGENLDKVLHYYQDPHPYYDCDVAIVGGKNSAAIYALECHRAGARVTIIHRGDTMHKNVKYWIRPDIDNRIKNNEIRAFFGSSVVEVRPTEIVIDTPDGQETLRNDFVLAMTGYQPDTALLSRLGVEFDPDTQRPRSDEKSLESDRPGLYLAGVVVAGMHTSEVFIENGRFHGGQIATDIAAKLTLQRS